MEAAVLLCIDFESRDILSWWFLGENAAGEARVTMHEAKRANLTRVYAVIANELAENRYQQAAMTIMNRFSRQPL